ncbi:MAG: HAD family hydrolase [Kiritimatiellia bacterium]|nr:HAD family hydrolase [Lentisphaerota bacterium]
MRLGRHDLQGVLFDFDGTLTRPGGLDFAAIKRAMQCPPDEPILEYIGRLPENKALRAMAILEEFEERAAREARPNEAAEDLIGLLRDRRLPLGILTRNSRRSVLCALYNFKAIDADYFSVIIGREDVQSPKPHPEGVRLAAVRMGVPVTQLGVVGDYRFDIEAGRRAGAVTIFLGKDSGGPEADYRFDSPAGLLESISRHEGRINYG